MLNEIERNHKNDFEIFIKSHSSKYISSVT